MTTVSAFEPLTIEPALQGVSAELLWRAGSAGDQAELLSMALPLLAQAAKADFVALVEGQAGAWVSLASAGLSRALPSDLLAEAMDRSEPVSSGGFLAAPLPTTSYASRLLIWHIDGGSLRPSTASSLAAIMEAALQQLSGSLTHRRRAERLEAILAMTSQWHQTSETEPLLEQMATTATRLLDCDRASIFLWDRPDRVLIGRPALGVPGGELRIADNSGIVGQVIATGQIRNVSSPNEQSQINREVDRQLGYQTRTLLCVPLRGTNNELFGAFEAINKRGGVFSSEDEAALVELAKHSAVALQNSQQWERLLSKHRHLVQQTADAVRLVGDSPAIEALRSTLGRVANTELAILILGENGTGKEVASQLVHYLSPRRDQPFIAVNCAAMSETLLESELFGHEKGAFTDAFESRQGKFELASGGTLFLDEIGDLSLAGQAKLLRVLEEKIVVRVGGSKPIHTDVRVIAATNQDLGEMLRQKRFRQDLYFRLNVVTLELPPLRDRGDDVLLLADHFLADFCRRAHRKPLRFTPAAKKRLQQHTWPGNVRELRNLMERLAYLLPADRIEAEDLAFILSARDYSAPVMDLNLPLGEATDQFQIEFIKRAVDKTKGNMTDAAKRLGLHRSNLYRKMRQLGMPAHDSPD